MRNYNDWFIHAFLASEFEGLQAQKGMRLLDLGCGTRPYESLYSNRNIECIAADYDRRTPGLNVRLDAQLLPFADASFDYVLFSEVVEHLPDAPRALAEISRVLRPGGVLLITWPFAYMMHEVPHDYARYTEFGMARLLAAQGLRIEVLVRRGGVLALAAVILEFLVSGVLEALVRLPLAGPFFRPVKRGFLWLCFSFPRRLYFTLTRRKGLRYRTYSGEGLAGWRGHMEHWTLGYCVRARKEAAR